MKSKKISVKNFIETLTILFLIAVLSCYNHKENKDDFPRIEVRPTKGNVKKMYISELISDIRQR